MQVLAINCPACGEPLFQFPNGNVFEWEENGFVYGCENLECEGAVFRFHAVPEEDERKYTGAGL